MNGNITKAGITADLEAMKQIGLGGATIVNVDCGIPRGPVQFMSPEWREDFKFAVQEANRLGLETVRGKLRRLVEQRRPVEHRDQRDAARHDQRSARDRPDEFQRRRCRSRRRSSIFTATSPCSPFPHRRSKRPLPTLMRKPASMAMPCCRRLMPVIQRPAPFNAGKIVDLTSKLTADGKLNWQVPAGKWVILRVGYTPTGVNNHPAPWKAPAWNATS